MVVPVPLSLAGTDDLLSIVVLFHMAILDLLWCLLLWSFT